MFLNALFSSVLFSHLIVALKGISLSLSLCAILPDFVFFHVCLSQLLSVDWLSFSSVQFSCSVVSDSS